MPLLHHGDLLLYYVFHIKGASDHFQPPDNNQHSFRSDEDDSRKSVNAPGFRL